MSFDHAAFLDSIRSESWNWVPRLAYADYLEEKERIPGDAEVAERIRKSHHLKDLGLGSSLVAEHVDSIKIAFHFQNGLATRANTRLDDWMLHGPRLVKQHPIDELHIVDVKPFIWDGARDRFHIITSRKELIVPLFSTDWPEYGAIHVESPVREDAMLWDSVRIIQNRHRQLTIEHFQEGLLRDTRLIPIDYETGVPDWNFRGHIDAPTIMSQ